MSSPAHGTNSLRVGDAVATALRIAMAQWTAMLVALVVVPLACLVLAAGVLSARWPGLEAGSATVEGLALARAWLLWLWTSAAYLAIVAPPTRSAEVADWRRTLRRVRNAAPGLLGTSLALLVRMGLVAGVGVGALMLCASIFVWAGLGPEHREAMAALIGIAVAVGVLSLAPGVLLFPQVVVLEKRTGRAALGRAWSLSRGVRVRLLALTLLCALATLALRLPLALVAHSEPIFWWVGNVLIGLACSVGVTVLHTAVYFSRRAGSPTRSRTPAGERAGGSDQVPQLGGGEARADE